MRHERVEEVERATGNGERRQARLPSPFVIGAGRSGTTLLRMMLDAHPELAIPPETRFVPRLIAACRRGDADADDVAALLESERNWADFGLESRAVADRLRHLAQITPAEAVRAFFCAYAERFGKSRWGDKTPTYGMRMPMIAAAVPEARFVQVIRDPRDVAASWKRFRALRGDDPLTAAHWAEVWMATVVETRVKAARVDHYLELRYEDLIESPERTLRRVCEFLALPFDPAMLAYHERASERLAELAVGLPPGERQPARTAADRIGPHELLSRPPQPDRIGGWREELSADEARDVAAVAGDLLGELGYVSRA
jgi:hypothetical protein